MNKIITNLLDQDLYKLTIGQVSWRHHPSAMVEYTYNCRGNEDLSPLAEEISKEIDHLCKLEFTKEELNYLGSIRYIHPSYIYFLRNFKLNREDVIIKTDPFEITIKGPWLCTIMFEIFLLAIVSEIYYKNKYSTEEIKEMHKQGDDLLTKKIEQINSFKGLPFRLIEFGTRRRFSKKWQEHVLKRLIKEVPTSLFGTSNVNLAKKYNLRPIGTMAHEYLQAFQALDCQLIHSQQKALETWVQTYRGELGIALTDVISMNAFLRDFDLYFAKLFDGLRHDSGCPFEWGEKAIAHYEKLGIDPKTKALVFSDGLDIPKAIELCKTFEPRIKTSFGIGTNLTNDFPNKKPLNHVIKMTSCNGKPVAKLSDSPGKSMCKDQEYLTYLKRVFNYPN